MDELSSTNAQLVAELIADQRSAERAAVEQSDQSSRQVPGAPERVIAIIPARFASQRCPGKPLALIAGKAMILHVVERVRRARKVSRVVVATDDARILDAVVLAGGGGGVRGAGNS